MTDAQFDVLGIGNAIVDVIARTEDDFLVREKLTKGTMRLIDADERRALYAAMGPAIQSSGGSAGNTAAGVASLGGRAAFIGKVADDELGALYRHDMHAAGVHFATPPLVGGAPTARSMILITPDGERTMNTYLGACQALSPADIDETMVAAAAITYLEGYLWDPPLAKEAFRQAAAVAHRAGRQVALTLSDAFCVDRFRDEFLGPHPRRHGRHPFRQRLGAAVALSDRRASTRRSTRVRDGRRARAPSRSAATARWS